MRFYNFMFIILCVAATQSSTYSSLRENVISFLKRSIGDYDGIQLENRPKQRNFNNLYPGRVRGHDVDDARTAKDKAGVINKARNVETRLNLGKNERIEKYSISPIAKERYHMDPVLNFLKRRSWPGSRRSKKNNMASSGDSSSSKELGDWKDQWQEYWLQKKFEAVNTSGAQANALNMVAARPWGVECGDPSQHDMPWGTCMLAMECDAEYRIYRGDYFCGRTSFVCCALQYTNYDMYQGLDVSFGGSDMPTDSAEKHGSAGKNKKSIAKKKEQRIHDRRKRKRAIKRTIKKIMKEMRKIIGRVYRNGTAVRQKETKVLKKYIEYLKNKYRKDRKAVSVLHELEIVKVDNTLQKKLEQIQLMNEDFVKNSTFRDIVVNGTISKKSARMLVQAYPELEGYMDPRLTMRRTGGGEVVEEWEDPKDYLEYDIEYGLLYL